MFRRKLSFLSVGIILFLGGCTLWNEKKEPTNVVGKTGLKVVNVLDKNLYNDAHISGSIQVDFDKVKNVARLWDKNDPVVFYCSNYQCQASFEAARQLKELGFANAMAYEGGMEEWYRLNKEGDSSYRIEGLASQDYLKIKVAKPEHVVATVKVISAEELKQLMQKAGLL